MESGIILHCADLGLKNLPYGGTNPATGLNRRFEDVYNNFKFLISEAIKNKVKYFIIAGDINEERQPESILIEKFAEGLADLISQDINVIIITGNHDLNGASGTSTTVSYIKALGLVNTYVADLEPERFEFDDVTFHCVPYMFPAQADCKDNEELTVYINDYINNIQLNPNTKNVLVSHYSLDTTFEGLDVDEPVIKNKNLSRFDYVALGHIHKYEMFKSFCGGYTGSMFCKDFGEQNDKYFNLVKITDTETMIKPFQVPERIFEQLNIDVTHLTDVEVIVEQILQKLKEHKLKDVIFKMQVKANSRFNPKLIYEYLRKANVFHYLPLEWKIPRQHVGNTIETTPETTDTNIVEKYLESIDKPQEFKDQVLEFTTGVISAWEQDLVSV